MKRFWEKVKKTDGCWTWMGAKDRKGYGKFSIGGSRNADGSRRNSMVSAHRVSYELNVGAIPSGQGFHGTCVLHRCDNPSCVRPDHLFRGTNLENVRDMDTKGRRVVSTAVGGAHANAVLDENAVREIVRRHRYDGVSQAALAEEYGVAHSTINHIFTGRLWAHLGLARGQWK